MSDLYPYYDEVYEDKDEHDYSNDPEYYDDEELDYPYDPYGE